MGQTAPAPPTTAAAPPPALPAASRSALVAVVLDLETLAASSPRAACASVPLGVTAAMAATRAGGAGADGGGDTALALGAFSYDCPGAAQAAEAAAPDVVVAVTSAGRSLIWDTAGDRVRATIPSTAA